VGYWQRTMIILGSLESP